MAENFTAKQKEIVARKMGYDGPMQMFDEYLASTPSDAQRYAAITSKFAERMARGGMVFKSKVRKFVEGGTVTPAETSLIDLYKTQLRREPDAGGLEFWKNKFGEEVDATEAAAFREAALVEAKQRGLDTSLNQPTTSSSEATGVPVAPTAPTYTAVNTTVPKDLKATGAGKVNSAKLKQIKDVATVSAPDKVAADTITPTLATEDIRTELDKMELVQGEVSDEALAEAVTQDPTTTAVGGIEAAQTTAGTVAPVADRTVQEGELVSGPTVDMARVEETLAKTEAAQGVVTEEMTIQGQLNTLLANFDAGKPPPWAAASMRTATAQLAARGLGASSLAGQAIIQATLEAATPLAEFDAKIQQTMSLQNLSNRQATALEIGRQRAIFLGQEFDQAFQTRVKNAATISDIANKNFDAKVTIALENARIASTTNIANLSARNAMQLAEAAQVAALETANLNNRQLVAVDNAKAFLAMDLKNLDIEQQTAVFKAKTISDSLTSDAGFANAAAATNATNKLEADKINATLALTAEQYNAAERNKISVANMNAANELAKFNAEQANDRAEFNSRMANEIKVANAKILADVSVANTAATNAANAVNAKNATDMSSATYAQQTLVYRDLLSYSFKAGEEEKDRIKDIAVASINASAMTTAAEIKSDGETSSSWGKLAYEVIKGW